MATISTNRRAPTPAPAPTNWFQQQGVVPTYAPVNVTQPGGDPTQALLPIGYGNDTRLNPMPTGAASGGTPTPDEVLAIVSQFPATYEGARAAQQELERRYGANAPALLEHPTKLDKWQFPNGQVYDLMNSAGSPAASWVSRAVPETAHVGGGGGAVAAGGMGGGGGAVSPGAFPGADPSFDFRLQEGQKALERSAAAKGTLLTGGHLKALARYGQDYASTEFGNTFDRNYRLATLGLNAANAAAGYGSAYGGQTGNLAGDYANRQGDLITGAGNAGAAGTIGGANAWRGTLGDIAGIATQIPWWIRRTPTPQPGAGGDYGWQGPPWIEDNWGGPSNTDWQGPPWTGS